MSSEDASKNSNQIPEEVKELIIRKLRIRQREQKNLMISSVQAAYSKLQKGTQEDIRRRQTGKALNSTPLKVYREIGGISLDATKKWPEKVWEITESLLETAQVVLFDGHELETIIDEFAWGMGNDPFTLGYINPGRFKEIVIREAGRYGITDASSFESFNRQLDLAAAAAQCGIINAARFAREKVSITIVEYLYLKNRDNRLGSFYEVITMEVDSDCLPSPPKNIDEWFLVIRDAVSKFYKKHKRCPNEVEAWMQLRIDPPEAYGIRPGKHCGEPAIFMDEQALGKRTFMGRWKRYTTQR